MKVVMALACLFFACTIAAAGESERVCVDASGNTYYGDPSQRSAGMQPTTPCLPPGTWEAIRNGGQFTPGGLKMADQAEYEAALKHHLEALRNGRR